MAGQTQSVGANITFSEGQLNVPTQFGGRVKAKRISEGHYTVTLYPDNDFMASPSICMTVFGEGFTVALNRRGQSDFDYVVTNTSSNDRVDPAEISLIAMGARLN